MKESFDALIDHLVTTGFFLEQAVEVLERGMIERVLSRTQGNQSEASKILGIHRNTLLRKMVEHDIGGRRARRKPPTQAVAKRAVSRAARKSAS